MAKFKIFITLSLFFLLVVFRLQVRILNPFSADELKEIGSFKSVKYLITEFLPTIPGGAPGDYLLVLPFYKLLPSNFYILGVPGLISHILVFAFLPKVITKLGITGKENYWTSIFARLFFVFDPTLTFQSMEVRPYANLPFYWIINVFISLRLVKLDLNNKSSSKIIVFFLLYVFLLAVSFVWHYYMVIILLSIYLFLKFKQYGLKAVYLIFGNRSLYVIVLSTILAIPFWKYFSSQTGAFPYNTFDWLGMTIAQIYAIDKGGQRGLIFQNWIYFGLLLLIIFTFLINVVIYLRNKGKILINFIFMNLFLVVLPLGVIVLLDVVTSYMFLYRQFVWIMVPFYIANAIAITKICRKQYA